MEKLHWINGMAIFVAAIFVLTSTFNPMAHGCDKHSSINQTNSSSGVNGSSNTSAKPSAAISSSQISTVNVAIKVPLGNQISGNHMNGIC